VARNQVRSAERQVYIASPDGSHHVMAQAQLSQARDDLETAESRLGCSAIAEPGKIEVVGDQQETGAAVAVVKTARYILNLAAGLTI
jgi:HlyD family secretion protein